MARDLRIDDVLAGKPTPGTLLKRGVLKRCPRCGERDIYRTYFRMRERCPACGYLFEREPGFFVGAYLINFAIIEGVLFVLLMGFIAWKDQNPDAGVLIPIGIGVVLGVVGPVVFYPYSRTIWSAFDLLMTPLEVDEIVAAADAVAPEPPIAEPAAPTAEAGPEQRPPDTAP
jgi:uncharacterized protein (DUF983 family)